MRSRWRSRQAPAACARGRAGRAGAAGGGWGAAQRRAVGTGAAPAQGPHRQLGLVGEVEAVPGQRQAVGEVVDDVGGLGQTSRPPPSRRGDRASWANVAQLHQRGDRRGDHLDACHDQLLLDGEHRHGQPPARRPCPAHLVDQVGRASSNPAGASIGRAPRPGATSWPMPASDAAAPGARAVRSGRRLRRAARALGARGPRRGGAERRAPCTAREWCRPWPRRRAVGPVRR